MRTNIARHKLACETQLLHQRGILGHSPEAGHIYPVGYDLDLVARNTASYQCLLE